MTPIRKRGLVAEGDGRLTAALGRYEIEVRSVLNRLDQDRFGERLWNKDASLWKADPEVQEKIANRLGWLTATQTMAERAGEMTEFARSVKAAGIREVVLLGMGGSSLGPEVLYQTYGARRGFPRLTVLDTTDPATLLKTDRRLDLKRTHFIVASKSGTTVEVECLFRHFWERLRAVRKESAGDHFVAITDPGTPLERMAREKRFRKIFLNPPDVGGRYSALTYFGLVPAALIGMDLKRFLERAESMAQATIFGRAAEKNPAVQLGAILGVLAEAGRDKVTFIAPAVIGSFGVWAEQLLAESTGKEGKGLVPVVAEPVGKPDLYGDDRIFVHLTLDSIRSRTLDTKVAALEQAGHPVVRIRLRDRFDLAGEFFRWEVATAAAGAVLGINPFDEPNVAESKENTRNVIETFEKTGRMPSPDPALAENGIAVFGNMALGKKRLLKDTVVGFLDQARPGDYLAIMAYLERSEAVEAPLQEIRHWSRNRLRIATTLGFGPRFLHSTGQIHKGGGGKGLFLQITAEDETDLPIPDERYSFGQLKKAQALGDFQSLESRGFRILRIHLTGPVVKGLDRLTRAAGIIR